MKKLYILLAVLLLTRTASAQGIFNQKGARIKNLLQQILLFKTYGSFLEKGYSIAKDGLTTIGSIKRGDLRLHTDHFAGLSTVNPGVAKYAQALDILSCYAGIKKIARPGSPVYRQLLEHCTAKMEDLDQLLSHDQYQLSDAERISRIQGIYQAMRDMLAFAQYHAGQQALLQLNQQKELHSIYSSRLLYSTKNP